MSFETQGIEQLRLELLKLAEVPNVATEELKNCAVEVRDLARKMAPVDEGNLEKAIKIRNQGAERNSKGQFFKGGQRKYVIYIDNSMPVPERDGKVVGDYAWLMHEHLTPFGPFKLGDKSREKQASDPKVMVGGKFLERAGEELRDHINSRLARVVFKYIEAIDN